MKIGLIGAGNIGASLVKGWLKSGCNADNIILTNPTETKLIPFANDGVRVSTDNLSACEADVIVLAVKPWLVEKVICELRDHLDYNRHVVVSLAAGVSGDDLKAAFDRGDGALPHLLRCIPNTAVSICCGVSFVSNVTAAAQQQSAVLALLEKVGMAMMVSEKMLEAGMKLASCGMAYALRYIRAAAEGGVELGFRPSEAIQVVAQTVKGASAMLLENGSHPETEIDKVTTAGGVTIRGLNAMEHGGFTSAVIRGLTEGEK